MRSDEHSVTTRFIGRFDHEFFQIFEHVPPLVILPTNVRRNIWKNRVLTQVILDDFGNVGIDDLIVGDPRSRRICESYSAGAVDVYESGNAQHRIRPEGGGIEKVVIDPAIDHVNAFETFGRSHHDVTIHDDEVSAFDK